MSTERKRMESIAEQFERQTKDRKEMRAGEEMPQVFAEMTVSGKAQMNLRALVRNALAENTVERPTAHVKVVSASSLEQDGCDFLKMGLLCLEILEVPADCRLFVMAVIALSAGDNLRWHVMTDAQIGLLLGYERHAVKEKREALIDWMEENKTAVLDIRENDRDPVTRQYLPTEYRPRILPIITKYIRNVRARRPSGEAGTHHAQLSEVERNYGAIKAELRGDVSDTPLIERRESKSFRRPGKPQAQQMTLLGGRRESLLRHNIGFVRDAMSAGHDPFEVWRGIQSEVADALFQMTRNHSEFTE